jgi:tripartite-type tricarboxylate transporter receptor subunit TctC
MTELLEKAFAAAAKLPQDEQDRLAQMLLDDLAAEEKWDETFATSQDKLALLADEALIEYQSGRAKKLAEIL